MITLITGEQACNTCPAWRAECEYRAIVAMPEDKRIAHYKDIAKKRGEAKAREVVKQVNQYRRAANERGSFVAGVKGMQAKPD